MATVDQIMEAAQALGKLIATTDVAGRFETAAKMLSEDVEAQRNMNDYNRMLEAVSQKQASGQPIEVHEKQKLEQLQGQIIANATLREVQMAQMDYMDLLRRVDQAMLGDTPAPGSDAPGSGAPGSGTPNLAGG